MTYENIKKWTLPEHYRGAHWPDYYVFLGRHRDPDTLTDSNFDCGLSEIGGESETVLIIREYHWAVGYVEWVAIHESDTKALDKAESILARLKDYPILNESDLSEREHENANQTWAECYTVRERAALIKELSNPDFVSIFAARRDYIPSGDCGALQEAMEPWK